MILMSILLIIISYTFFIAGLAIRIYKWKLRRDKEQQEYERPDFEVPIQIVRSRRKTFILPKQ